jgi:hypothetical protein
LRPDGTVPALCAGVRGLRPDGKVPDLWDGAGAGAVVDRGLAAAA